MDKEIIKFDDTEIEEYKFHQNKSTISRNDIDINKIVVSNKFPLGKQHFKYFIGTKDSEKIRPLCILYSQMIIYIRNFHENRHIYFLIKEEKVFIKYMEISERVSNIIKTNLIVNLFRVKVISLSFFLQPGGCRLNLPTTSLLHSFLFRSFFTALLLLSW